MPLSFERAIKTLNAFGVSLSAHDMIRLADKLVEYSHENSNRPEKQPPSHQEMLNITRSHSDIINALQQGKKVQAITILREYFENSQAFSTPSLKAAVDVIREVVGQENVLPVRPGSEEGR